MARLFIIALALLSTAALADRPNIQELTVDVVRASYPAKFWRPVAAQTPSIPVALQGQYAYAVLISTDQPLTEGQMDELETAIENLDLSSIEKDITKAFVLIGPAEIPSGTKIPDGFDLSIRSEIGFQFTEQEQQ